MSGSRDSQSGRRTPSWVMPISATRALQSTTFREHTEDDVPHSPVLQTKRRLFDSMTQPTTPNFAGDEPNRHSNDAAYEKCEWPLTWKSSLAVFSQLTELVKECADRKMLNRSATASLYYGINQLYAVGCGSFQEQKTKCDDQKLVTSNMQEQVISLKAELEVEKHKRRRVEAKQKEMECPVCSFSYYASEHKQFCALKCGHILCEDCVNCICAQSVADCCDPVCPKCRKVIECEETRQKVFF